jgi:hypothetical protein
MNLTLYAPSAVIRLVYYYEDIKALSFQLKMDLDL